MLAHRASRGVDDEQTEVNQTTIENPTRKERSAYVGHRNYLNGQDYNIFNVRGGNHQEETASEGIIRGTANALTLGRAVWHDTEQTDRSTDDLESISSGKLVEWNSGIHSTKYRPRGRGRPCAFLIFAFSHLNPTAWVRFGRGVSGATIRDRVGDIRGRGYFRQRTGCKPLSDGVKESRWRVNRGSG